MKFTVPIKQHYLDDGSQTDQHFLDVAQKLVDLMNESPYSNKQHDWKSWLNECGQILRYRMLKHLIDDE